MLCALFWRPCLHEETRFGSLPFSILLCLWVDCLLWLSVIFKHEGAHLKRLNANLISYMKQSWFIFPELFFPTLQTTERIPRFPSTHTPLLAGIMPFNIQSKELGSVLWTLATTPNPPTHLRLYLQSISAHSRCWAKPKDNSDIEKGKSIGNLIYTLLT